MKKFLLIGGCVLVFFCSFAGVIGYRIAKTQYTKPTQPDEEPSIKPALTPATYFQLMPPKQSLTGKVIRLNGTAMKLARNIDDPVRMSNDMEMLEGEQITASPSSSLDIRFAQSDLFSISPETILAFPSTNPEHFLVKLDKGLTVFQTDDNIATISARSLHALFSLSHGKAQLSVDPDSKIITYLIAAGQGQIGYIDADNNTLVHDLAEGDSVIYDDTKRILKIQ